MKDEKEILYEMKFNDFVDGETLDSVINRRIELKYGKVPMNWETKSRFYIIEYNLLMKELKNATAEDIKYE